MTVMIRVVDDGLLRLEWPGRLSEEAKETLFWVLDGIDGVDGVRHGNYSTDIDIAGHLTETTVMAALVANAMLDDERLAEFLDQAGWGELEIQVNQ